MIVATRVLRAGRHPRVVIEVVMKIRRQRRGENIDRIIIIMIILITVTQVMVYIRFGTQKLAVWLIGVGERMRRLVSDTRVVRVVFV